MAITTIVGNGYIQVTGFDGTDWSYATALSTLIPFRVDGVKLIPSAANEKVIVKADVGYTTNPIVSACLSLDGEPRVDANFGQPFLPVIDGTLSVLTTTSVVVLYGLAK